MDAVALESMGDAGSTAADTGDPERVGWTWDDTGDPGDRLEYSWDTGAPNWGGALSTAAKSAAVGASAGAALGSVFPGIGTTIGGAVGGAVGAIGGFFSQVFGGKPKPTPRWIVEVMEEAKAGLKADPPNPMLAVDSALVAAGRFSEASYRRAKAAGELPSQVWQKNREKALRKGKALDKKRGAEIQAHLRHLSPGEQALVSAAIPIDRGKDVLQALIDIRNRVRAAERQAPSMPAGPTPPAAPPVVPIVTQPVQTIAVNMPPPVAMPPEPAIPIGSIPAGPPTMDDLPAPEWHLSQQPMPRYVFEALLRAAPVLQRLPQRQLELIAGFGPKARDVSGVDPVTREYVSLPGETFAGIAEALTGDPNRAVELAAANPVDRGPRLHIPPGWLEFHDFMQVDPVDDTGEVKEGEKKEPPKATATKPKDSKRQNVTARVLTVKQGDTPIGIAKESGATKIDPKWFNTLVSVNRHKPLTADKGNFVNFYAGEILNYPDTWPAYFRAVLAPTSPDGPVTPGPVNPTPPGQPTLPGQPTPTPKTPTGATADPGKTVQVQSIMVTFALRESQSANPQNFGMQLGDISGTMTPRTKQIIQSFQVWWNERHATSLLRTDGELDAATDKAISVYAQEVAANPLPSGPKDQPPSPPSGDQPSPGPFPGPTIPTFPPFEPPHEQPPANTNPAPAHGDDSDDDDDSAIGLFAGAVTLFSLLK